jgi:hypothetical protein
MKYNMKVAPKPKSTTDIGRIDERVIALSDRLDTYQATNSEAHSRQEKGFEKLTIALDNLGDKMNEYNGHLATHIKRTDLAESRMDTLESHQKSIAEMAVASHLTITKWTVRSTFIIKILAGIASLILAGQGIIEIIKYFKHL